MKGLRGLLCVLLALCLLTVQAGAAGYSGTGSCGEDLTWSIADRVLTIRGTGEMDDHAYEGEPGMPGWDIYSFTKIVIEEGVTSIGACAFSYEGCPPVTSVELPSTLERIYYEGFRGCDKLVSIELPEGLTYIGAGAFQDCAALKEINIPDSVTTLGAWFLKGTPLALGSASAWARSDIQAADRLDLIPAECSFNYQRDVTREQIAAILRGGCGADAAAVTVLLLHPGQTSRRGAVPAGPGGRPLGGLRDCPRHHGLEPGPGGGDRGAAG